VRRFDAGDTEHVCVVELQVGGKPVKTWGMYGKGGNKVYALPDSDAVVAATTTNYRVPHANDLTDSLFTSQIEPTLAH